MTHAIKISILLALFSSFSHAARISGAGGAQRVDQSGVTAAYGMIYTQTPATAQNNISTTPVKFTGFDLEGASNLTTLSASNDEITVDTTTVLNVVAIFVASRTITSDITQHVSTYELYVDDVATGIKYVTPNTEALVSLASAGRSEEVVSFSGIRSFSPGEVASIYVSVSSGSSLTAQMIQGTFYVNAVGGIGSGTWDTIQDPLGDQALDMDGHDSNWTNISTVTFANFFNVTHDTGTLVSHNGMVGKQITDQSHGFTNGDVLRMNSTNYALAQADSASNAEVVGIVGHVYNSDTFFLVNYGNVRNLSGLTSGSVYFLSPSTAGAITLTEPTDTGDVSKPVLISDTANSGYILNQRGLVIP